MGIIKCKTLMLSFFSPKATDSCKFEKKVKINTFKMNTVNSLYSEKFSHC